MLQSERLWIVLLALTAFLAGGAGGVLIGRQMAPRVESGPFAAYEARFVETFSLDDQERRDLRHILERYHAEVEALEAGQAAFLEDELEQIGAKWRERIRTWILTPDERARFDRLAAGLPPPNPTPSTRNPTTPTPPTRGRARGEG